MDEKPKPKHIVFRKKENEANLAQTNLTHPFDRPDFLEFLQAKFPDSIKQIQTATRPGQSSNADELEKWEGDWILRRKDTIAGETQEQYLLRLLYEEFFSVNQNPGQEYPPSFKGSFGLTPGGLTSHFYFYGEMNGHSIDSVMQLPFKGKTLKEGMVSLMITGDWEQREKALALGMIANECTYFDDFANSLNYFLIQAQQRILEKITQGKEGNYNEEIDVLGYRLLAMLKAEPEMVEPIADSELLASLKFQRTDVSRAEFIASLWHHFSQIIFNQQGFYRLTEEAEVKAALQELLKLRIHPELQIFFKYLSPSGYINDWLNPDHDQAEERTLNA